MALKRIRTQAEYDANYAESVKDPVGFWTAEADTFEWHQKWNTALEWDFETPNVKWFAGGKLNITENCLDRHLKQARQQAGDHLGAERPEGTAVRLTYRELHERVCQYANVLKRNGAKKGDRICIYMPMVPELVIATLACARIGAIHSVVFCGFSAQSLATASRMPRPPWC
jgi:acetyl-CoA synthetase